EFCRAWNTMKLVKWKNNVFYLSINVAAEFTCSKTRLLSVVGEMQQSLYLTNMNTVDELRQRLVDVWQVMLQYILVNAIDEWRKRLRVCIRAKGGHFSAYAVT